MDFKYGINIIPPRLAVACILKCRRGRFLAMFAIKCASWTSINSGTSKRSACSSVGHVEYASVQESNSLLERILGYISIYTQPHDLRLLGFVDLLYTILV